MTSDIFDELHDTRFRESFLYLSSFIWFALFGLMCYNSLQWDYLLLTKFKLPYLLFLRIITHGEFDAFPTLKTFQESHVDISKNVILIFNEMYIQNL